MEVQQSVHHKRYTRLLGECQHSASQLVAVTKQVPFQLIQDLYQLGQRHFAENRLDQLEEKAQLAQRHNLTDIRWHFIAPVQRNKLRRLLAIPQLDSIHTIDRLSIIEELIKIDKDLQLDGLPIKLYLQIKTSLEEEKSGFPSYPFSEGCRQSNHEAILSSFETLSSLTSFHPIGLMTMAPLREDLYPKERIASFQKNLSPLPALQGMALSTLSTQELLALTSFAHLNQLREVLEKKTNKKGQLLLSMGMTQDYKQAILFPHTVIRVGSLLFSHENNR